MNERRDRDRDRDRERDKDYRSKNSKKSNRHRSRSRSNSKRRRRDKSYDSSSTSKYDRRRRRDSSSRSRKKENRERKRSKSKSKPKQNTAFSETRAKSSNFSFNSPMEDSLANSTNSQALQTLAAAQNGKSDRKLYVGNIPDGICPTTLVKLLNAALLSLKANLKPGEPILSAWISTDAHYAFVEFRSAEEANNGFQLNNISILGQPLRVGRPKTYSGMMTMGDDGGVCNTFAAALTSGTMKPVVGKKIQPPSRVLCFKNIVKDIDIENEEIFDEIRDDIKEECRRFGGQVESIFIPRKDIDDNFTPGMGNVYVMFDSLEGAKEARRVNIYL